jgi:hypothetical protein
MRSAFARRVARRRRYRVCVFVASAALAAAASPAAGDSFAVGTFTKSTNTSAPVTQAVAHGLGETPKVLIIWSAGKTTSTLGANARLAFGMSDTSTDRAMSFESDDGQFTSAVNRRVATTVVTMVDQAGTLKAEADLQSVDATNFTLNWTTNNSTAYIFHFIAIGGTHVQAKVVGWTMRTSTGNQAITGVSFQPEVVISAHAGAGLTSAPSATAANGASGLSAMDARGNQWAQAVFSTDGSNFSDTTRYQRRQEPGRRRREPDEDRRGGVRLDGLGRLHDELHDRRERGGSGVLARAARPAGPGGDFTKSTSGAPASQSVTGVAFRPRLVLLASTQNTANTSPATNDRFGVGASYVTAEGGIAVQDADGQDTTSVDGIDTTTKTFVKVNNDTQTTDAQADLTSLDTAGFTLNWTTNDAVATEMLYLALSVKRRIVVVSALTGRRGRESRRCNSVPAG